MPIKNLDSSLFDDGNKEQRKRRPRPNMESPIHHTDNEEIFEDINDFMSNMPDDMYDKFKEFSDSMQDKLANVNLSDLFNIEVEQFEFKNPAVRRLIQILTNLSEEEIQAKEDKINELCDYLTREEVKAPDLKDYVEIVSRQYDPIFSIESDGFIPSEFIKEFNFTLNGKYYTLEDLSNIKLVNPLTNEEIDLSNGQMNYLLPEDSEENLLADRILLYPNKNDTSVYLLVYAYKINEKYHFYIPKRGNYALHNIEDKLELKKVRQYCFKYKTVPSCRVHIKTIFVKHQNNKYSIATLGSINKEEPKKDSIGIYLGQYTFDESEISSDFKRRFDISDNTLPIYFKYATIIDNDDLAKLDYKSQIMHNFELKYNQAKNYLYIVL